MGVPGAGADGLAGADLQAGGVMRLTLSSAAAPDASFDDLLAACARRGFAAVELEAGHAHGVSPSVGLEAASAAAERAARAGIGIAALRLDDVASVTDPRTPRLAAALGAPVVVRIDGDVASTVRAAAPLFAEAGATVLLAGSGDVDEIGRLRGWIEAAPTGALGLAWDVTPGDSQIRVPAAVLEAAAGHIRHIRLHGGGPRSEEHTSELQSRENLVCRLLLEKKKKSSND